METSKKMAKPLIKVHEDPSSEVASSNPLRPKALHKKQNDHLSVFRSASPSNSEHNFYLALPSGRSQGGRSLSAASLYNENGVPCPISEEKLLIKSFEVLANAIGIRKSFSTSDILGIETSANYQKKSFLAITNRSHSEIQLSDATPLFRLEASSRSLSTWVAVGDTSATTQLPSPQARVGTASPSFTAADLVRSVNKRIRQTYLKKRLLTTYKALDRMTQMGFNLEKLKDVVNEGELAAHPELVSLLSTSNAGVAASTQPQMVASHISQLGVTCTQALHPKVALPAVAVPQTTEVSDKKHNRRSNDKTLSCKEIERDRGKPLSKYDRNVMIFDWLHTLDESANATTAPAATVAADLT